LRIPSRCRRGVFGLTVCVCVCLSVCLSSALPTTTFAYFHYRPTTFGLLPLWAGVGWGGGGTWELFFLSFFIWELVCQKAMRKYLSTLVRLNLSLTLISACPSLLLTLGDSMTHEKVHHHTEVCCCCCCSCCCCF
jgi:hypothetical protein